MSTKESVASPKWSEKIKVLSSCEWSLSETKVFIGFVNVLCFLLSGFPRGLDGETRFFLGAKFTHGENDCYECLRWPNKASRVVSSEKFLEITDCSDTIRATYNWKSSKGTQREGLSGHSKPECFGSMGLEVVLAFTRLGTQKRDTHSASCNEILTPYVHEWMILQSRLQKRASQVCFSSTSETKVQPTKMVKRKRVSQVGLSSFCKETKVQLTKMVKRVSQVCLSSFCKETKVQLTKMVKRVSQVCLCLSSFREETKLTKMVKRKRVTQVFRSSFREEAKPTKMVKRKRVSQVCLSSFQETKVWQTKMVKQKRATYSHPISTRRLKKDNPYLLPGKPRSLSSIGTGILTCYTKRAAATDTNILRTGDAQVYSVVIEDNELTKNEWQNCRHRDNVVMRKIRMSGDVELNPGPGQSQRQPRDRPGTKLILVTQNCRGIAEERKFKHLLNNCYKIGRKTQNYIVALQETMITNDQKIRYGWRGNHVFTPGSGHGRGCLTLLPVHIQPEPDSITHFNERGHIFKANLQQTKAIVINIYAPTGHSREKINFFQEVKRELEKIRDPTDDVYLMGDMNTVFESYEVQLRSYSEQEQRHSRQIKQIIESLSLDDIWTLNRSTHTWRQPGTRKSSRLDRIYFQHNLRLANCSVDWTFTNSDHGAVIGEFTDGENSKRQKHLRLNPESLKSEQFKIEFLREYSSQVQQIPPGWDPHQTLEFHKCAIRSAYTLAEETRKRREKGEYEFIKEDLQSHITALENCTGNSTKANRLMNKINILKAKITNLNLEKGSKLANALKTKWYNEGEKSNKYFLALLRRRELNGQLNELEINQVTETDKDKIEEHVTTFYKALYNQDTEQYSETEKNELLRFLEPLNDAEINAINEPLTIDKVYQTLKDTNDSCPGPDGIPYSYLKATWQWFGSVLINSWHYSMQIRRLPESHRTSWLRLIPKAGKNTKDLKNWRPITLSNCDHKIITKTLSRVLSVQIGRIISGNQTAYLKGRSISDNLRLVSLANKLANKDPAMDGILIALDARKAFDSVKHTYIKDTLRKIGLTEFVKIFEVLYQDSQVDVMINEKICKGYKLGNGVKQGDALSCTLFILAMEPLIRNIEANREITLLRSQKFGIDLPKCIGYADDINIMTTNSARCVKATIKEYERFSKISGLQLNADKTEIFGLAKTYTARNYSFQYMGQQTTVTNTSRIKINGLELATDPENTHKLNFEAVKQKLDSQLASWANRGLSILGKILIYKTFGLSQIIYVTRVLKLSSKEHGELRNLVYKFIWNKNYQANKAPDRIKRAHLCTAIKKGGFGMIDHEEVIKGMNTKQLLTNLQSSHPLKNIITALMVNPDSRLNLKIKDSLDGPAENYAEVLCTLNRNLLGKDLTYLQQDRLAIDMLMRERLKDIVRADRRNSIEMGLLRHQGKTTVRELLQDPIMTNHFRMRLLHYSYSTLMDACIMNPVQIPVTELCVHIGNRYKMANRVTSKEIRLELLTPVNATFKIQIEENQIKEVVPKIAKLKCVKLKSLALRLLHGDIYTGTRLHRFGMADTNECCRCQQPEDLEHLLLGCWYPKMVWTKLFRLYIDTDVRRQTYDHRLGRILGYRLSIAKLKLHLEIIRRLSNKERPKILPRQMIIQALDYLIICDREHWRYYKKLKRNLINVT